MATAKKKNAARLTAIAKKAWATRRENEKKAARTRKANAKK